MTKRNQVTPLKTAGEPLVRIARVTGALYLSLAVTGMLGFLLIRPMLFAANDAQATLTHLRENAFMARVGIALEMAIVVSQALAGLWFFRLFRTVDDFAASAVMVFGAINAVAILASAAFLNAALGVALMPVDEAGHDPQLMYLISASFWKVGALFFGLWLIPMGWCVLRSRWMPRALGFLLVVGGTGYLLSAFVGLAPGADAIADGLTLPATVGEFWMIGYLLSKGVKLGGTTAPPPEAALDR